MFVVIAASSSAADGMGFEHDAAAAGAGFIAVDRRVRGDLVLVHYLDDCEDGGVLRIAVMVIVFPLILKPPIEVPLVVPRDWVSAKGSMPSRNNVIMS
jgi:hypothetical protein